VPSANASVNLTPDTRLSLIVVQYIPFLRNVIDLVSAGQQVVATSPMMIAEQDVNVPPVRGHDVRAWVNVIYGCNEHCTYCVVPATRGTEQSRTMEAILEECIDLASCGYKEVTLIGQVRSPPDVGRSKGLPA
jgi:tRNA-2-methylthio-N6-dimethylallyladenosine synthase